MSEYQAKDTLYERIYLVVEQIPAGKVSSYGDIAHIVGGGCDGRLVGHALGDMNPSHKHLPWQRVVARDGVISTRGLLQRQLLEAEGVSFNRQDHVIMNRHRWEGPSATWCEEHACQPLPTRPPEADAEQLELF